MSTSVGSAAPAGVNDAQAQSRTEVVHDPIRQANALHQSLSQDKMPIGFFLGAGCPVSIQTENGQPLIPDIAGLSKVVCSTISADAQLGPAFEKLRTQVCRVGEDCPNIERLLSHVRALTDVAGEGPIRGVMPTDLATIEVEICRQIEIVMNKRLPTTNTPYHRIAAWISSAQRAHPVEVFTTNYDLLLEQALEEMRVPYFDGFVGSREPFFDVAAMEDDLLPSRWARVWKLHGSINWSLREHGAVVRLPPTSDERRRVIHPSHLKYSESRRMPYLATIDRLRAFLKKPSAVLVICGYSFRDDHLNEVLFQGLSGNPNCTAFALMYGPLANYPSLSEASVPGNLVVLAVDAAIIGTRAGVWRRIESPDKTLHLNAIAWTPIDAHCCPKQTEI